ncbi:MAG: hypothetical protein EXR59_02835 [Dehalococcoidia bacterium]|nr:hypothetical protein [Dehalococcoidia bacterium]
MNTYRIGRLLFELKKPEVLEEFKKDPHSMMEKFKLSEEDKQYIIDKNPRPLFDAGIHPQLISQSGRTIGMNPIGRDPSVRPALAPVKGSDEEEAKRLKYIKELEQELRMMPRLAPASTPARAGGM